MVIEDQADNAGILGIQKGHIFMVKEQNIISKCHSLCLGNQQNT